MAEITAQQMAELARRLLDIAGIFAPNNGAAIIDIIKIGTEFNDMIKAIKDQTKENEAEVWEQIRDHATDALDEFKRSVKDNMES